MWGREGGFDKLLIFHEREGCLIIKCYRGVASPKTYKKKNAKQTTSITQKLIAINIYYVFINL